MGLGTDMRATPLNLYAAITKPLCCYWALTCAPRHAGLLLISHDFRLLDQVAQEVWVCDKGITKWESGMREYKDSLKKAMALIAEG